VRRCIGTIVAVVGLVAMPGVAAAAVGNGMIAYGGETGMMAMNANGTGSVPLFSPDTYDRPVFSPSGNAVAVRSWPDGHPRPDVAVARFDANDGVHVVAADGALPAWSPDSTRIAYARYIPATDDTQIRVVNADGKGDAPVVLEPLGDGCAYREFNEGLWWLPDGRLLYLCGADIVTIKPDGTGRQTHGTVPDGAVMWDADLSPDGTTFAGPRGEGDVGVWNWTTGATAEYTADGGDPGKAREWMTWSPDGTKILYEQAGKTVLMPAGGGGESVLAGSGGAQYAWQPCVAGVTVTCAATTLNGTLVTGPGAGGPGGGGPGGGGPGDGGTPPPPPPPPFTAFDAKPAFAHGAAKQKGAKSIAVKVRCDVRSAEPCVIALTARTAKKVAPKKHKPKRKIVVAKTSLTVAPGKTRKTTLRLTAKARTVLKRQKKLKLVIIAKARRSDGASVVATTTVTVKAPTKKPTH
jgi:hypothetical protein